MVNGDKPLANPWVDKRIQCTENTEIKDTEPNSWYNPNLESEEINF